MPKAAQAAAAEQDAIAQAVQAGLALHRRGLIDDAERLYAGILKLVPDHFDALHLSGVARQQRGDSAEAARLIGAALKVRADSADALGNYGQALLDLRRLDEALSSFDASLTIAPDHLHARLGRAATLIKLSHFTEALVDADYALRLDPKNHAALSRRAYALSALGRHAEAVAAYDAALAVAPSDPAALCNRGYCQEMLGDKQAALASYDAALALAPAFVTALVNRANTLVDLQREEEAAAGYEAALSAAPDHADARFKLGITRLRLRDFARGWPDYDWRWRTAEFVPMQRGYPCPVWQGQRIDGALLVWSEQGLGDQILFAGMLPELFGRAGSVVLDIEARLIPLFARSFPALQFHARQPQLYAGAADAQIPLGSVGRYLRTGEAAFPDRAQGYLAADQARTASLRARLADGRRLVGLSWRSRNPKFEQAKSAALREFEPLLRRPDCRFVDLQYGDTFAEREAIEREFGVRIEQLADIDNTADIDGLAALIAACDLVVTVSNTTAHLAGALGKETFVLVPFGHGRMWCWFNAGDSSPWYPQVRLWRQQQGQAWTEVVGAIAKDMPASPP